MRFLRGLVCVAALVGGGHVHVSADESSSTINAGFSISAGFGGFGGFSTSGGTAGFDVCALIADGFKKLSIPLPAEIPTTSVADLPTLPPFLNCLPQNVKTFFQIFMKLPKRDGEPSLDEWRAAGWPEATAVPNISNFRAMASQYLGGGMFGSSGMGFPGISGGGGGGAGAGGHFPRIPDFNQIFDKLAPRMIPCSVSCPPSTLCVNGNQCITPQPICTKSCKENEFCQSTLNTTLLEAFNAQATASAFANIHIGGPTSASGGAGAGAGAGAGSGGGININFPPIPTIGEDGRPQITIGSNGLPDFNSLLSLIHVGGRVNGTCRSLTPRCTPTSCAAGEICSPWDGCIACSVCGSIDLSGVARGGFDPSRFTGNITVQGNGAATARALAPGIIAQIQGNANVFSDFVFGASGAGSAQAGSAISAFVANSQSQMNQLLSNIQDATVQLGENSKLISREIRVAVNATLAVVLQGGARAGCNTSININGPLIIRGVATAADIANGQLGGVFDFPPRADGNTIGANAIVNVNGGAGLTGDLGSLGISISAAAAAAAAASVPSGSTLRTSGAVLGAEARFIVRGALQLLNSAFQPTLSVASGAVVNIIRSGSNFTCGPLDLSSGGKVDIDAAGTSTFFKNVTQCAGGASIRIKVTSIAAVQSGAVLFTYSSTTATIRATYKCGVELYDATGAVLALKNPNVAAGRRLLDSTSGGTVTWDETGATYTNTNTDTGAGSGAGSGNKNAAQAVTPTLMVVMAFVAAAMARVL